MDLYSNYIKDHNSDMAHYGVMGMRWGIRKADQYDNIYYRSKYNKKKNKLKNDLKNKNISKGKYLAKRAGDAIDRYTTDGYKMLFRSLGRNIRGVGRLVTGKTWDRHNDQEFTGARQRAVDMVNDPELMKRLDKIVQMNVNTVIGADGPGYITGESINDILDREQLNYRRT